MSAVPDTTRRARRVLVAAAVVLLAAALVLWRYTPLAGLADEDRWSQWIEGIRGSPWAPAAVIGIYVVAGLIEFPIMVLIGATAAVFEPLPASLLAFAGALSSATVFYAVGAQLAGRTMRAALGRQLERVSQALERRGIVAIVVIRSIPVAPFTVVNLAAGSLGVRFRDYFLGTALGLAPGILVMTAFGEQLREMWEAPTAVNIAQLLGVILVWITVIVVLQRLSRRWRARSAPEAGASD